MCSLTITTVQQTKAARALLMYSLHVHVDVHIAYMYTYVHIRNISRYMYGIYKEYMCTHVRNICVHMYGIYKEYMCTHALCIHMNARARAQCIHMHVRAHMYRYCNASQKKKCKSTCSHTVRQR